MSLIHLSVLPADGSTAIPEVVMKLNDLATLLAELHIVTLRANEIAIMLREAGITVSFISSGHEHAVASLTLGRVEEKER